ncbi:hypothetical protein GCM10027442_52600 [Emticicia fontis]
MVLKTSLSFESKKLPILGQLVFKHKHVTGMKKQELQQLKMLKVMTPILIIGGAIAIFKAGYATGQWLYAITH